MHKIKPQERKFAVIVIGAGHAGCEAAAAAARVGVNTLLLTHNLDTIGQMSCNPAIGGIGKGHLVKEIDALDGLMAKAIDKGGIQFRTLNASKGVAVQATRAQADRVLYKQAMRSLLDAQENLTILQQTVDDLIIEDGKVCGIVTNLGTKFYASSVILTAGTFLNGTVHIGTTNYSAGRMGDPASIALAGCLRKLPLRVRRLKTGTPPRLLKSSIDFSKLKEQAGDKPTPVFSFLGDVSQHPQQISCYIAHTNPTTHQIIRDNLKRSALFAGIIKGVGPRYCPSIEDKIVRFADRTAHQIFLEPEGLTSEEIYPNGISTSLPFDVQQDLVHSMVGLENAELIKPGYAIEYDFFDPRDLHFSLESKTVPGLFLAGQVNGTTGYEEAAAQGLIAGLNAALKANGREVWWSRRDQAYIGVMLDDLILRGTNEPYRMFTSRAEYRLLLREDNADLRLTEIGHKLGVVADKRWLAFSSKFAAIAAMQKLVNATTITKDKLQQLFKDKKVNFAKGFAAQELLRRPEIGYAEFQQLIDLELNDLDKVALQQVITQIKYYGYIARQQLEIDRQRRLEDTLIPDDFNYAKVSGFSTEVKQKLIAAKPKTVGQAARIPGVTPAAISILLVMLK